MEISFGISIIAASTAIFSLTFAAFCFRRQKSYQLLLEFTTKRCEDLDDAFRIAQKTIETDSNRLNEQVRRVAWLEARVRQTKSFNDVRDPETDASSAEKLTMTERRHRVLKLSNRGQNNDSIASQLGMHPGEVELIVNLYRTAVQNY